jgi:hypothetical protein
MRTSTEPSVHDDRKGEPVRVTAARLPAAGLASGGRGRERWPVALLALGLAVVLAGAVAFGGLAAASRQATLPVPALAVHQARGDHEAGSAPAAWDDRLCCRETR